MDRDSFLLVGHGSCSMSQAYFIVPKGVTLYFGTGLGQEYFFNTNKTNNDLNIGIGERPKHNKEEIHLNKLFNYDTRQEIVNNIIRDPSNNKFFSIYPPGSLVRNIDISFNNWYTDKPRLMLSEDENMNLFSEEFDLVTGIFKRIPHSIDRTTMILDGPLIYYVYCHLINIFDFKIPDEYGGK